MEVAWDKTNLRRYFRQLRNSLPAQQRQRDSQAIADRLYRLAIWSQAPNLFCYLALGSEVDTRTIAQHWLSSGRVLAVPGLSQDHRMQAVVIQNWEDCQPDPDRPGGWTSRKSPLLEGSPAWALIPGLAFTRRGQRLGQGGGCYDRFLAEHSATIRVAVAFDQQITDSLPTDEHDQAMHWIITPTRTLACPG